MPRFGSARVLWAQLPSELWERVFALVRKNFPSYQHEFAFMKQEEKTQQSWPHQLRTVCKSFAAIFHQNPSYYCDLVLYEHVGCSQMLSLLKDLEHHGGKVKKFASSSYILGLEAALSALQPHQSQLVIAHFVGNNYKTTLLLLPAFSSIQLIKLAKPNIEHLDLQPLQFLPKLIQLNSIHGSFLGHEHLMQLKMVLSRADCHSNCRFAACLEHLFLVKSKLAKFHYPGLSACDNLERFSLLYRHPQTTITGTSIFMMTTPSKSLLACQA